MKKIIGISGRMRSGKSLISKLCNKAGYETLSFATPLKQICSQLLNISIDELNELKNNNEIINHSFTREETAFIHDKTLISLDNIQAAIDKLIKPIQTVRDLLQFIGTDIIREYNIDWHINEIKKSIQIGHKYVFDDLRFPNEKKMIEELGGETWFIIRPFQNKVSHHFSEESLFWKDFNENIIINYDIKEFIEEWNKYIYQNIKPSSALEYISTAKDYIDKKTKYVTFNKDYIAIAYDENNIEIIDNPLSIENIKKYL